MPETIKLSKEKSSGLVSRVDIFIQNEIESHFGFSAEELTDTLRRIDPTTPLTVHITSMGGQVIEGLAIYNLLRGHKGEVTTIANGMAGSIAGIIFLAGDKRQIIDNSQVLIHRARFGHVEGTASEIESILGTMRQTEEKIDEIILERTNITRAELESLSGSNDDMVLDAEKAVRKGVATEVISAPNLAASALELFQRMVAKVTPGKKTEQEGNTTMPTKFNTWLTNEFGLDEKSLSPDQRTKLQAKYTDSITAVVDDPGGDDPNDINKKRNNAADEEDRQDAIDAIYMRNREIKLNSDYLKDNLKMKGRTPKALKSHAIRQGWSADKFELELSRAEDPDLGHVGIHSSASRGEMLENKNAVAARLLMGVIPDRKKHKISGKEFGREVWFKPEDLEIADSKNLRDVSLCVLLDQAYREVNGFGYNGRLNTDGFINGCRDALFSLRMSGNTTWTGLDIFDDVANKALWAAYEAQNTTWQEWVTPVSVSDFKTHNIYRLTNTGGYKQVGADGELKHGGFTDDKYTVAADTYGKMVGLTRKDIINDDLGALNRIMTALGIEGARFLEEIFYAHLLDNRDTIFAAGNNNLISGASTALGVDGLTEAEQKFRDQVVDDAPIMVDPSILLVGTALSVKASELFTNTQLQGVQSANAKQRPDGNPHVSKFRPVTTGFLNNTNIKKRTTDAAANASFNNQSATQWFLMPEPNSGRGAVVMGAFLNGNQRPTIEQADATFNVLGLQWRAYHDAGAGSGDPKLAVRSAGA